MRQVFVAVGVLSLLSACTVQGETCAPPPDGMGCASIASVGTNPFDAQVEALSSKLNAPQGEVRAGAAESLGYLRAYWAGKALAGLVREDDAPEVRREAAMALAWCGGREEVSSLLGALDDPDWTVRQAAWVSLTNLTGMEWPYDGQAPVEVRTEQAAQWRDWWAAVPPDAPPEEVVSLLGGEEGWNNLAQGAPAVLSSVYKGDEKALTDGRRGGDFWQTKNVPFPQSCEIDLGALHDAGCVVVHQYGEGFCLTEYGVEVSLDGEHFEEVVRREEKTTPFLVVQFAPRSFRYVKLVSYATENPTYPCTLYEVEVLPKAPLGEARMLEIERGLRALGALGGQGAAKRVMQALQPFRDADAGTPSGRYMVQAGIRSLGRLREPESLEFLVALLQVPQWGRYAADALGDFGGVEAAAALIEVYPHYARDVAYQNPEWIPADDRPGLSPVDRMYETPFAIISALCRLPVSDPSVQPALRALTPRLLANLPGDFDGALLYEVEAHHRLVRYLLTCAGEWERAREVLFATLEERPLRDGWDGEGLVEAAARQIADVPHAAAWLPTLTDAGDIGRLVPLLSNENGWIRINAAKSLMFLNATECAGAIANILRESQPEAEYGFYGAFRFNEKMADGTDVDAHDEYNDPSPRWREAYARALGRLGAVDEVPLLAGLLEDERNVLDVQRAAALALDELGSPEALAVLRRTAREHPYHSVRLAAEEALWRRGMSMDSESEASRPPVETDGNGLGEPASRLIVFIKGPNAMPNDFQIDPWRQTYSTTDSGPTYRLGCNLYTLDLDHPSKSPVALTHFEEGYVADCEVSWDGQRIVFCHRGGDTDPWWHLYEICRDGTQLRQITSGPYHDVQPVYLPDGRIVCSSSRIGLRDEYHGYLSTGLTVMNPDGSGLECIAFNLGRDNEPAVLPDGRIVFSRLELFYSRLKTELTVQAVFPDGTRNVTLYGPERRPFWRQVTVDSGEGWWGEVPTRHRVLRLTQPQPYDEDRILCASTAGLTLLGPGRHREEVLPHDKGMAVTTPFPLGGGKILCAATRKSLDAQGKPVLREGNLGLYVMDAASGELTLLYDDPATAEFEARPVQARPVPPVLAESKGGTRRDFTTRFMCRSVHTSREDRVGARGKLVRVIEGTPITGRHRTHQAHGENAWRNHVGTLARVLGTVPLSADGSFCVEVPADHLVHFQVLDSDRRTVGNQLVWIYGRPGESRSCVGCHETPDSTARIQAAGFPEALSEEPVECLPQGDEFLYRAKFWNKGVLPDEGEERTRTVRAVNLLGRY